MTGLVATPPRTPGIPAAAFLQQILPGVESVTQDSATPFTAEHGWRGELLDFTVQSSDRRHLVAADYPVAQERALLYIIVDRQVPGSREAAVELLRSTVPFFLHNYTIGQLLAVAGSGRLARPTYASHSLFGKMRRTWSLNGVNFELAGTPSAGRVEVKFAVSPRPAMAGLIEQMAATVHSSNGVARPTVAFAGTTAESEHCALAYVTGPALERAAAAIYGDHHAIVIDGTYSIDERATFRDFIGQLLFQVPLRGSPPKRIRQVVHEVPAGWAVRTRDLTTHLIAPDSTSYMSVLPAEPREQGWTSTKKILYEDVISRVRITTPLTSSQHITPHGLKAELFSVKGVSPDRAHPFELLTTYLSDERFRYVVRYEDRSLRYRDVFTKLVDSIEPVPVPIVANANVSVARKVFPVD